MKKLYYYSITISIFLISCSKDSNLELNTQNYLTITTSGLNFEPKNLNCSVGDTILFELGSSHNAIEVSEENYNANLAIQLPNGFQFGFGENAIFVPQEAKTYYYVCVPHLPSMKARIIVQ